MNLSNVIAQMISDMLEDKNEIEIQRNILAQNLGCVPSQINYVLSSRFTPERGYLVESRRGGGGFIKITRVVYDKDDLLLRVISSVGDSVDADSAQAYTMNLLYQDVISEAQAKLILAALSEKPYRSLPMPVRDMVRADIFKQLLLAVSK